MPSRLLINVIAVIISAVFLVAVWITTGSIEAGFLRFFSGAVFVCSIMLFVWDNWIWKWSLFQAIPKVTRDISGTWETTLESFWKDPVTGKSPAPKTVYVVIRQTSSTASVTLISNESKSKSSLSRVVKEGDSWILHYIYTNESRLDLRIVSPIHHGSGVLSIVGSPAKRIIGSYWTDRESRGNLSLLNRSKKYIDDFAEGEDLDFKN
jgi:hypothetical protein